MSVDEAVDPVPVEGDPQYVPRYLLKDDNGRKFQSDDPTAGVLLGSARLDDPEAP